MVEMHQDEDSAAVIPVNESDTIELNPNPNHNPINPIPSPDIVQQDHFRDIIYTRDQDDDYGCLCSLYIFWCWVFFILSVLTILFFFYGLSVTMIQLNGLVPTFCNMTMKKQYCYYDTNSKNWTCNACPTCDITMGTQPCYWRPCYFNPKTNNDECEISQKYLGGLYFSKPMYEYSMVGIIIGVTSSLLAFRKVLIAIRTA